MGIQKCKNCGMKFNYNTLLKPLLGVADPVRCSNCGLTHYITLVSRFTLTALILLPAFFTIEIRSFTSNIALLLLMYLVYVAIIKVISPYILSYKLKENDINKE